jgi:hypothetical protein
MPGEKDDGEPKAAQHRCGAQAILKGAWPLSNESGGPARDSEDPQARSDVSP